MSIARKLRDIQEAISDAVLWLRYHDKPYREYYRAIMRRDALIDPAMAIGGHWERGHLQLERLIRNGLTPEHTVLDVGCGNLRGGIHIIRYLKSGNYTGTDISQELLDAGSVLVRESGLSDKQPHLIFADALDFREVAGKKFDYLHAQGLFSQMPPEDIKELLCNLPHVMHENSMFLASFFLSKNQELYSTRRRRNFFYPFKWFQDTCSSCGLSAELVETDNPTKQKRLKITLQ